MGRYQSSGLSVDGARAYVELASHLTQAMPSLIEEGKVPESEAVHEFLDIYIRVVAELRRQAEAAALAGRDQFDADLALTAHELRTYSDMSGSLGSLLQIMGMRGSLDVNVPASASQFAEALGAGSYVD